MPHIHELFDFTVSAIIIHPTEVKVCLLKHKKYDMWLHPGGHVELNEHPLQALDHELSEEAGLHSDDYEIVQLDKGPYSTSETNLEVLIPPATMNVHSVSDAHKHIDMVYIVKSKTDKLQPEDGESQEIGWFSVQEIATMAAEKETFKNVEHLVTWALKRVSTM